MIYSLIGLLVLLLWSTQYRWWRRTIDYTHPRILMYHMVSEHRQGAKFNKLRVPPAQFERQVAYLAENGWTFAHVSDLKNALPDKTVVLTFDDGYRDNLEFAHPILDRYNAKATLYLVEDRFDRDWSTAKKAHHDSGELMQEPKLTDAEVEAMLASGVWELGAHTLTHANLPATEPEQRADEVIEGRTALQQKFNQSIPSFAYPFGIYDTEDVRLAEKAGYDFAVTTEEGIDPLPYAKPLELRRIKVSGKEGLWSFKLRLRTGRRK
jgi:peptidoglycan/xylan/chitin deacetylase (PgdA/CDA1 family)